MFYTFMKAFLSFMDRWCIEIFCISLAVFLISSAALHVLDIKKEIKERDDNGPNT